MGRPHRPTPEHPVYIFMHTQTHTHIQSSYYYTTNISLSQVRLWSPNIRNCPAGVIIQVTQSKPVSNEDNYYDDDCDNGYNYHANYNDDDYDEDDCDYYDNDVDDDDVEDGVDYAYGGDDHDDGGDDDDDDDDCWDCHSYDLWLWTMMQVCTWWLWIYYIQHY